MSSPSTSRRLASAVKIYSRIAWWGLAAPRLTEQRPLVVVQGVVAGEAGLLLSMRDDLWGWELPGGTPEAGEGPEETLRREIMEETGLEVAVDGLVGEYVRTGFRPHTARVYHCRVLRGTARSGPETLAVRWVNPDRLPAGLFPWYRIPIRDAFERGAPVRREDQQGVAWIWAALRIDLRNRIRGVSGDAGL